MTDGVPDPRTIKSINIKRMLVIRNPTAGVRGASLAFAAHLQPFLDATGTVYDSRESPPEDLGDILSAHRPSDFDAVAVFGGDGSVNAYGYHCLNNPKWLNTPLLVVPTGWHNAVANAFGVSSPELAIHALIRERPAWLPIWKVIVDGRLASCCLSSVALGTYADVLCDSRRIFDYWKDFVTLPMPPKRNYLASMYNTLAMHKSFPCALKMVKKGEAGQPPHTAPSKELRMLIASQLPQQHYGYSLTPHANFRSEQMAVTMATSEAGRVRMFHLLHREGPARDILPEDGVLMNSVLTLDVQLGGIGRSSPPSGEGDDSAKKADARKEGGRVLIIDGEDMPLEPGSHIRLERSGKFLPVLGCHSGYV